MVELESEGEMTRNQVAAFLHAFADELQGDAAGHHDAQSDVTDHHGIDEDLTERDAEDEEGKRITFIIGGDSATVTLPNVVDFEVEVESRSPLLGSSLNQEIDLELSWEIDQPEEHAEADRIEIE